MNHTGQIVGYHRDASGVLHSVLTDGTAFTVFDPPGGGGYELSRHQWGNRHQRCGPRGSLTVLDVPGVMGTLPGTFIEDIANSGRLVGYYGDDPSNIGQAGIHSFVATAVPEPTSLALVGIGLGIIGFLPCRQQYLKGGGKRA